MFDQNANKLISLVLIKIHNIRIIIKIIMIIKIIILLRVFGAEAAL